MKAEMQINQENNFTRKILNHIAPSLFIAIIPTSLMKKKRRGIIFLKSSEL